MTIKERIEQTRQALMQAEGELTHAREMVRQLERRAIGLSARLDLLLEMESADGDADVEREVDPDS